MRTNSGSAMVFVIIMSVSLFTLAIIAGRYSGGYTKMAEFYQVEREMRSTADTGALNAINTLRNDSDLWLTVQEKSLDSDDYVNFFTERENGYTVSVDVLYIEEGDHLDYPADGDMVHLIATASHSNYGFQKVSEYLFEIIEVVDEIDAFQNGMFANNGYKFMGATIADYTDSTGTPKAAIPVPTVLASNGTVDVQKPTNVTGNTQSNAESPMPEFSFEPGSAPEVSGGPDITSDITLTGPTVTDRLNPPDPTVYQCRDVDDVVITVNGFVKLYVSGEWAVNKPIVYIGTAPESRLLVVHQGDTGTLDLNGNAYVGADPNSGGMPEQFIFMTGHTGDIKLNGNAGFGGIFLAPQAQFSMNGTFDMYGAIIAEGFDDKVNGNFSFTYDVALQDIGIEIPVTNFADFHTERYLTRTQSGF